MPEKVGAMEEEKCQDRQCQNQGIKTTIYNVRNHRKWESYQKLFRSGPDAGMHKFCWSCSLGNNIDEENRHEEAVRLLESTEASDSPTWKSGTTTDLQSCLS